MHFRLKLNSFCRRKGAFSHGNFHLNVFSCNQLGTAQLLGYWILIIKSNSVWLSTRDVVNLSIVIEAQYTLKSALYQARFCALRALGLLLADGAPTVGRGKTF